MQSQADTVFAPDKHQADETVKLVVSGADYFDRLEEIIDNTNKVIHLQTYIFLYDSTGKRIVEALLRAAFRKVKVFVLIDAYGSNAFPAKVFKELENAGIQIRLFAPFSTSTFYLGRRLHHKVVVADFETAMIGGINIADKYNTIHNETPWLDYAVLINDKKNCERLQQICEAYYHKKKRFKKSPTYNPALKTEVQVLQNDWLKRKTDISVAYIRAIRKAEGEIVIVGSYFLPGNKLTLALKRAAKRGVKIKIILSGISDVAFAKSAGNYLYSSFLRDKMELYEWDKSVVHGKAAVIDGKWMTIGSFNLNHLSSYGSIEMNAEIKSVEVSQLYLARLNAVMAQCEQITVSKYKIRNGFWTKINNFFVYHLVRLAFIFVTYLPYKRFFKKYISE